MKKGRSLGLNELMIVNPGLPGADAVFLGEDGRLYQIQGLDGADIGLKLENLFLGEDGTLYQVQGLHEDDPSRTAGSFFLSDDGILYRAQDFAGDGLAELAEVSAEELDAEGLSRYFLGQDGTLYELTL